MSKNNLPKQIKTFIRDCTQKYGTAKLVVKHNNFHVESELHTVLRELLLRDPIIAQARVTKDASTLYTSTLVKVTGPFMKEMLG
jgi:DNA excision repair protein ERCC-3